MSGFFSVISDALTTMKTTLKPYRIRDIENSRRSGIVASSFKDLKAKIQQKFNVKTQKFQLFLEDGTEVDEEYFDTLENHTVLVFVLPGQVWTPKRSLSETLTAWLKHNSIASLAEEIRNTPSIQKKMLVMLTNIDTVMTMTTDLETRQADPDWFEGLAANNKEKEGVMKEGARRRVRGYFYDAQDFTKKHKDEKVGRHLEAILKNFREQLKKEDHFSDYFARSTSKRRLKFCDDTGWFTCEGLFSSSECDYPDHIINPYGSREARLAFSTWNLDHRIEKSRDVLPNLKMAVEEKPKLKDVNWKYFYQLLFTRQNLKLVHNICHDKSAHTQWKCDPKEFYI